MKRLNLTLALAAVVMTAMAPTANADYRCARQPLSRVDAIACAKAAQDLNALRQFVWNTRMIHHLYFYDYVRPQAGERSVALTAPAPEQTADASAPRKR